MKKTKLLILFVLLIVSLFSMFLLSACMVVPNTNTDALSFDDASYIYDGTPKSIEVKGLPSGASLTYDKATSYTDAGIYPVTATVTTWAGDKIVLKATLTITKAKYDMSGICFNPETFVYDGEGKSIEIEGLLPEGVTVTYEGNGKSSYGSHTVIAKFTSTNNNYEKIPDMSASYTIYDASGLPFYEITFDSNGGSEVEMQTALQGSHITMPTAPRKNGYIFDGWYYNDSIWDFSSAIVDKHMTLVAKWISAYTYKKNESGGITITGYKGNEAEIIIPETVDGLTVTEIGELGKNESITSITLPSTLKTIKSKAFYRLKSLKTAVIPYGVEVIEENAFGSYNLYALEYRGCSALESIEIPESVTFIGEYAFGGCISLKSIKFPSSLEVISESVVGGCTSLESVEISNGTKIIDDYAFSGCTNLKTVIIPESVIKIGDNLFSGCSSIEYKKEKSIRYLGSDSNPYLILVQIIDTAATSAMINPNTRFIHSNAFENCSQLTSVSIPDTVVSIGTYAFYGCSKLSDVNIPIGVTEICEETFFRCFALKSISLPESLTYIGQGAFYECGIDTIAIPDNVVEISRNAFSETDLTSIRFGVNSKLEMIGENAFSGTKLTSFYLPKGVRKLEYRSLYSQKLKSLIIAKDSQLEKINSNATYGNITTVYYGGSAEDWIDILIDTNKDILNAKRYYYSETKPVEDGDYWYYDEKTCTPVIW
ncbi:MAG: leucine-rich repeat protein [Clostridia bacterium]|nr:leucine-rich repeat protein [Clostridia bacterium]